MENPIETIKRQLSQLKELHDTGAIPVAQFEKEKATLERRLLDYVLSGAVAAPAIATTASPTASAALPEPQARPGWLLMVGLAVTVVALAGAGYWWKGSPEPQAAPHATNAAQIAAMTDELVAHLKEQPNDAEAWSMLARIYSVLGKHPEALKAYEKAVSLRKDDATLLADYADALAIKNNQSLAGEPMRLIERALKLEPGNTKALALAGTHAFDRKDYAGAVKYWEKAVQTGGADNPMVQQMLPGLAQARDLAGLPSAGGKTVSGNVSLAPALLKQVSPQDTVFIFARASEGSRMPLAIVRKQVKDLPVQFLLDDSLAMSPANKLSGAANVVVGARVSKSGNATPQPGDFSGQSGAVAVGASGLQIEISEVVKP
jgi:cytochrome c-type biogenesis protein CcmH